MAYNRQYYLDHKQEFSEQSKKRYWENPEKYREASRKRYQEKPEEIKKYNQERYQKNKDKIYETQKRWEQKNPEAKKEIKKRYRETHREELREKGRIYAKKNRKRQSAYRRELRKDPIYRKNEKLKDKYGITLEDYNNMVDSQLNKCLICKNEFSESGNNFSGPCIDHSHMTGKIRGLLCRRCNAGIGGFDDDCRLLEISLSWLDKIWSEKNILSADKLTIKKAQQYKYYLKRDYNITLEQFEKMLIEQK
jgi:Recombination endonuclease VII